MATKIDKDAIEMAKVYDIRLDVIDSGKDSYTKQEVLDFLDDIARAIRASRNAD